MHCHIGWHVEKGFALRFIERYDEIGSLIDYTDLQDVRDPWDVYDKSANIAQDDSRV